MSKSNTCVGVSSILYCFLQWKTVVFNLWSTMMKDLKSYNQLHQRWALHAKSSISRVVLLTCSHLFHPDRHSHVCPILPGIQSLPSRSSTFWVRLDFSMSTHCFTQKVHFTPNNRKGTCQSLCHWGMNVSNLINGTGNWDHSCKFKGYFRR